MSDEEDNNSKDINDPNTTELRGSEDDNAPVVDLAQAQQILFYQDAPINGPSWLKDAAQSQANFAQRLPGTSEWTIGNGVGALSQLTREEIAEKEKQESAEWFEEFSDVVEHLREEERQREEWAQEKHKYAGIEMTGEEWGEFADQLKGDTPLRRWLLAQMKKDGKTDAQAKELTNLVALRAEMQEIPKDQWNAEQRAADARLRADPDLNKQVEDYTTRAGKKHFEINGQKVEQDARIANPDMEISTEKGADRLSQPSSTMAASVIPKTTTYASGLDQPAFPSAPDLGEHHRAAMEAKVPLDAPKQIAALTPPAPTSPGGGFDV